MRLRDLRRRPAPSGALAELASAEPCPRGTPLVEVGLLALDLETTGLDPRRHEILSVGSVPVVGGEVLLAGATHRRVRPAGDVGDSAVVHGLTDDELADEPPLETVLPELLHTLAGPPRRVLVAHLARVETGFLDAACRRVYGTGVPLDVVDTLELERRLLRSRRQHLPDGALRLDACRRRHRLPRYRPHSALTDALACAELLLAQCAELETRLGRLPTLADVLGGRPGVRFDKR